MVDDRQEPIGAPQLDNNPFDPYRIPTEIGSMLSPDMDDLSLVNTHMTGTLQSELFQLTNLSWLRVDNNELTGTIPTELGQLQKCEFLLLQKNIGLMGTLPSEVAKVSTLIELGVQKTSIGGIIPKELYSANLPTLSALILRDCRFRGTISTSIDRLNHTRYLLLSGNEGLIGTVPSQIGLLQRLVLVKLEGTSLTGSMPSEMCKLRAVFSEYDENIPSHVSADRAMSNNGSAAPMFCPKGCCSICCERETAVCAETGF